MAKPRVLIYDCTLRDGTQGENISLSVHDNLRIAECLDEFGIHYIEGGWPGSNPKDAEFFDQARKMEWKTARIAAFGSTRHWKNPVTKDPNLKALLDAETPTVTLVGKSWDFHVREILDATLENNLAMIRDSVAYIKDHGKEVMFDAEHFFDGYKANPEGRGHFSPVLRCTFAHVRQVHYAQCALPCEKMATVDGYSHSVNRP